MFLVGHQEILMIEIRSIVYIPRGDIHILL